MNECQGLHDQPETCSRGWKVPCEVYSRIVGYLRPVQNWNPGKQQEFKERKKFDKAVKRE